MRLSGIYLLLFTFGMLLLAACSKEDKVQKIVKNKLTGYVQKGPYINGTSILMYELDESLRQTGKNYSTQIINNRGSFEFDSVTLSSQYVEFFANGYYFNEITGTISSSQLSLYTISDIKDLSTVNVNILTHLEKSRVENLVNKGITFTAAKDSAQKEVLAIFGFEGDNMDRSEGLDISVDKPENAILLAISLILQGDRSVGDLTELLAHISTDIREDGKFDSPVILASLRNSTLRLNLSEIRDNLKERYFNLEVNASIPAFETYITDFLVSTGGLIPKAITEPATNITSTSATLNGIVNPNDLSTSVAFEYGTTANYGLSVTASESPATGTINVGVSAGIADLLMGTTYYFRTVASSSAGTVYGEQLNFTTDNVPTLTTVQLSSITGISAMSGGNIISDGGSAINVKGLCWNTTGSPSITDMITNDGSGTDNFTSLLTDLELGTTYYIRAYAINEIGIGYGDQLSFKTLNVPTISTTAASLITATSANCGGNILSDGGATITARGICWSTMPDPTIDLITTNSEEGTTGIFKSTMSGLSMGTTYYVRAYASNSVGIQYGSEISFTTQTKGTVIDIDGNVYNTITIGPQAWMVENLKVTHFNDGSPILNVIDGCEWYNYTTPVYSWYENELSNKNIYGGLYNWHTVNPSSNSGRNVCPVGWRVPTTEDWNNMEQYLIDNGFGYGGSGKEIAKSLASTSGWNIYDDVHAVGNNQSTNNLTGFSALATGGRVANNSNCIGFWYIGQNTRWWCSPVNNDGTSWTREISFHIGYIYRFYQNKQYGESIRCIKD